MMMVNINKITLENILLFSLFVSNSF